MVLRWELLGYLWRKGLLVSGYMMVESGGKITEIFVVRLVGGAVDINLSDVTWNGTLGGFWGVIGGEMGT